MYNATNYRLYTPYLSMKKINKTKTNNFKIVFQTDKLKITLQ